MAKKKPVARPAALAPSALDPDPHPTAILPPERLLGAKEVLGRIGVTYPCLWNWMREGKFPRARRVGTRRVAWLESEVTKWITALPARRLKGDADED